MTRVLRTLLRRLAGLAAAVIIAFAALTLVLRLALPHADGLRGVVAERLGEVLGAELTVGALGLHLRGLQPELRLDDALLRDPLSGERLLALDALRVDLDLRASVLAAAPRIDGVSLVGARLEVRRSADGRIGVRGLDRLGGGDADAAAFFLREGHFSLVDSDIYWTDSFAGVPPLQFRIRRAELFNRGAQHRLRVRARPPGDSAGTLTLLADLRGPPGRPGSWSGQVYADWRGSDLARVLHGRLPAALRLATDGLHVTSWNHLSGGRLLRSTNHVWLDDLVLRRGGASAAGAVADTAPTPARLALGDLGLRARWQRQHDGWRLDVPRLELFGGLLGAERTALRLRGAPVDGGTGRRLEGWLAGLPLARLAEMAGFLAPDAVPSALRPALAGRIAGRLEDLRLRLDLSTDDAAGVADWLANGRVTDLGVGPAPADPVASAPGPVPAGPIPPLDGIDLRFSAAPGRGAVGIAARDAHLDLRPHLIAPLRLTRLAGRLAWRRTDTGVAVWSHALAADTPDVTTLSRLALRTLADAPPYIDLHTHIRGGDADAVPRYLPASKMDDRLEAWLDRAIVAGELRSGDLLLRGPLGDFPFDAGNGWFRLELRVRDGVLDYQPPRPAAETPGMSAAEDRARPGRRAWPRLEDMDLTLRFDRRSLDLELAAARILSTQVTSGSAHLPNLWEPEYLAIEAEGTGPLTDGLAVLADTPLSRKLGGIPRALAAAGDGRLRLALDVPLRRGLRFGYNGRLGFGDDAAISLRDADLRLADIDGELRFDRSGLHAEAIAARLGEQPLRIDIQAHGPSSGGGRTDIIASGHTPLPRLAAGLPSPWWGLAQGSADWQLRATLDNADAAAAHPPVALALTSDLIGVALDLPPPFGKPTDGTRALRAATRLVPDQPLTVDVRLGDIGARAELAWAGADLVPRRIAVDLSGPPEALPVPPGVQVRGRLGAVDLGAWLDWGRAHEALLAPADAPRADLSLLPVRVSADSLRIGALRFEDVRAAAVPDAGGWRIGVETAGNSASVRLPGGRSGGRSGDGAEPVRLRLDNLDLAPLLAAQQERTAPAGAGPDPRLVPPLSLHIEALRRGSDTLGRLRLELARAPGGLAATDFSLTGPLVTATGSGRWTRDDTGYTETAVAVDLRSQDLGALLRDAGYYSALDGAPSKADLTLRWPGGPGGFRLDRARGSVGIDIGAGRLLEVEPGVGRMLGVLNLGALERRLSLDFSDVLDTGFTFDSIAGQLFIGNGEARIDRLDILASTADIRVRGSVDLEAQTFDQSVRVTPKIGTGVAIAGAVAGGPLVGAAVLLADQVSGNAVSGLASYEYQVTGPWAEPEVRRVSGSNGIRSVPDLLLPEATGSGSTGTDGGAKAGDSDRTQEPARAQPVSPFLDQD